MHALLTRQINRFLSPTKLDEPKLARFLSAVDQAYVSADEERALLEHSLSLSSRELKERYEALQRDIAKRHTAENERDTFFQLSPDLLCILLPNFTFKQLNLSWQNALGFELGELTGASLASLIHPDDLAQTMKALEGGAAKPGGSIVFQNRLRAKTGPYRCLW